MDSRHFIVIDGERFEQRTRWFRQIFAFLIIHINAREVVRVDSQNTESRTEQAWRRSAQLTMPDRSRLPCPPPTTGFGSRPPTTGTPATDHRSPGGHLSPPRILGVRRDDLHVSFDLIAP